MKNGTMTVEDCNEEEDDEEDEEDEEEDESDGDNGSDDVKIDDGINFDLGDTLGKLLTGITQVCKYYYLAGTNLDAFIIGSVVSTGKEIFCKSMQRRELNTT
jgi:hypothetical protein